MPKVIIWRDGAIESEFDPRHRDWRMGRSETNDITLLDPRKSVSRFHAELREEDGRWVFIDLNSQNGSWLNGERINRVTLDHGTEVLFGDYKLVFEDERLRPTPPIDPAGAGLATASFDEEQDRTVIAPGRALDVPPSTASDVTPPPAHTPPPSRPVTPPSRTVTSPPRPPAPPPVAPAGKGAAAPAVARKGVSPVLIVVPILLILLGALGFVAWRVLQARRAAVEVADVQPTTVLEPPVTPTPVAPVPPDPAPSTVPGTAADTPSTPPASTPEDPAPPGAATPATSPPATATPATTTPGTPGATRPPASPRPRRAAAAPKESPALVARYDEGRRALDAGRFGEAQRAFEAVLAQQPAFRDTAALLQKARAGQQAAAREKLLADAQNFEASGEWSRAVSAYEKAGASEQAAAVRQKMHAAGDDAYRKARQFDARNIRSEAETWYQRAVEWLPTSDPRRATAQQRLAAIKGGGE